MKKIRFFVLPIIAMALLVFHGSTRPKYYLTVAALFQNEGPYLKEWIEYHRLLGVDHFYLINNLSTDHYREVLEPYIAENLVELIDWPTATTHQKDFVKMQVAVYSHILTTKKRETRWLALIDIDEFLLPRNGASLPQFLKGYESFGGLVINWQMFGTSNVKEIPPNATLIGSLTRKAPVDHPNNRFIKTICQPRRVKKMTQPHFCRYQKPFYHVGEKKNRLPPKSLTSDVNVDLICINHYTYRDEYFFETVKKPRMLLWYPDKPALPNPDFNLLEDKIIIQHVPALEKVLFER